MTARERGRDFTGTRASPGRRLLSFTAALMIGIGVCAAIGCAASEAGHGFVAAMMLTGFVAPASGRASMSGSAEPHHDEGK
jgi:hypothetical protein